MNEQKLAVLRTIMSLPVEAAAMPTRHLNSCNQWKIKPITRERVERDYGEAAAKAWDDIMAARKSYYREAERHLDQIEHSLKGE